MRKAQFGALFAVFVVVLASPGTLAAHHFSAMYDLQHVTTVKGTVTNFELVNPHCLIHISVKSKEGPVQNWVAEAAPPVMLHRVGWGKETIKPGDQITVRGFRAKDGSNLLTVRKITLANGQELNEHQD